MNAGAVAGADLVTLQRHLCCGHLDDVGLEQRRDDVGRDQVIRREQPSVANRPLERAALYPILHNEVAGETGAFGQFVLVDLYAVLVQADHSAVHSREPSKLGERAV